VAHEIASLRIGFSPHRTAAVYASPSRANTRATASCFQSPPVFSLGAVWAATNAPPPAGDVFRLHGRSSSPSAAVDFSSGTVGTNLPSACHRLTTSLFDVSYHELWRAAPSSATGRPEQPPITDRHGSGRGADNCERQALPRAPWPFYRRFAWIPAARRTLRRCRAPHDAIQVRSGRRTSSTSKRSTLLRRVLVSTAATPALHAFAGRRPLRQ